MLKLRSKMLSLSTQLQENYSDSAKPDDFLKVSKLTLTKNKIWQNFNTLTKFGQFSNENVMFW